MWLIVRLDLGDSIVGEWHGRRPEQLGDRRNGCSGVKTPGHTLIEPGRSSTSTCLRLADRWPARVVPEAEHGGLIASLHSRPLSAVMDP